MKTETISPVAAFLILVPILAGCGASSETPPASAAQVKANIQGNHSLTDSERQALLDGQRNAEINRQIHLTGKLPNGQTIPNYKPPR